MDIISYLFEPSGGIIGVLVRVASIYRALARFSDYFSHHHFISSSVMKVRANRLVLFQETTRIREQDQADSSEWALTSCHTLAGEHDRERDSACHQ